MNPAQHLLLVALRLYRWIVSPTLTVLFGAACRFEPSCSVYAMEAVRRHGAWHGSWLAVKRVARCQPWGGCGCDPVPELSPRSKIQSPKLGGHAVSASVTGSRFKVQGSRLGVIGPESPDRSVTEYGTHGVSGSIALH